MATYYRWRKSEVVLAENDKNISIGGSIVLNDSSNKLMVKTETKPIAKIDEDSNEAYYDFGVVSILTITRTSLSNPHILSDTAYYAAYTTDRRATKMVRGGRAITTSGQDKVTVWGSTTEYTLEIQVGDFIEYVYSTSPSAYPINGVSGDYYYDQRTTVTSPTAPSGITTPAPGASITTPTVTVSWGVASSNTNYPVNQYELSYAIGYADSWTVVGTTSGTSMEVNIPAGTTSIRFRVRARDSNNQWGSYYTNETTNPVYLAPTLTVPQLLMQGQQATVNWTTITGADSYTLERKSSADADWTQVYSGANTTFSETAGTWTTVQYRVQAVFSGTPGGWATSAEIPVVSASALVISGQDGDLGTLVNDVPYSISTDTGNQITATITVNGAVIFSGNVGNSTAGVIPVMDLITGEGTITIEASVTASSGPVSAVRTWTYTKDLITFPNAAGVAQLTQDGKNVFPKTLAECVRLPGGGTLDQVMGFPCQIYTGTKYGINNNTELEFPFNPKALLVFSGITLALFIRGSNTGYCTISSNSYEDSTLEWKENSIRFVDSPFAANQTYTYVCFG